MSWKIENRAITLICAISFVILLVCVSFREVKVRTISFVEFYYVNFFLSQNNHSDDWKLCQDDEIEELQSVGPAGEQLPNGKFYLMKMLRSHIFNSFDNFDGLRYSFAGTKLLGSSDSWRRRRLAPAICTCTFSDRTNRYCCFFVAFST